MSTLSGSVMSSADPRVVEALERLRVPYELIEIDPAFADTAIFCEKYGVPLDRSANTIVVSAKGDPPRRAACVVLATTRLDVNRRVRKLLGARKVSFASAEEMHALTGMEVGGVTALALPDGLPLWVDERIRALDWVVIGAGSRGAKIRTSPEIFELLGAEFVADLAIDQIDRS